MLSHELKARYPGATMLDHAELAALPGDDPRRQPEGPWTIVTCSAAAMALDVPQLADALARAGLRLVDAIDLTEGPGHGPVIALVATTQALSPGPWLSAPHQDPALLGLLCQNTFVMERLVGPLRRREHVEELERLRARAAARDGEAAAARAAADAAAAELARIRSSRAYRLAAAAARLRRRMRPARSRPRR